MGACKVQSFGTVCQAKVQMSIINLKFWKCLTLNQLNKRSLKTLNSQCGNNPKHLNPPKSHNPLFELPIHVPKATLNAGHLLNVQLRLPLPHQQWRQFQPLPQRDVSLKTHPRRHQSPVQVDFMCRWKLLTIMMAWIRMSLPRTALAKGDRTPQFVRVRKVTKRRISLKQFRSVGGNRHMKS